MLDIDHFKLINDTHGHAAGDEALKAVAKVAAGVARETDIVARIGGEEFALILPETDREAAAMLAERFRATLENTLVIYNGAKVFLKASFGVVATNVGNETRIDAIMIQADAALYKAKQKSRNQVVIA
jgi:diguanylate cyclase (GGDEF)-like protein